jgi:DNA repair exonuclease SbcCD ATPase subunit
VFRKSTATKLQEQLDAQRKQTSYQREEKERYLRQRDAVARSASALKGVVTKKKKQLDRVINGVCPCCNRHFKNLQRHMDDVHKNKEQI